MNSNTGTDLLRATIIHNEGGVLIIVMPNCNRPSESDSNFWKIEEKNVILDAENDKVFLAKSWTISDQLDGVDVLKFWSDEQSWFYQ